MRSSVELPREWLELFASLSSHRVRFLVVGAHAMAAHGQPRYTQDLDVFAAPSEANARRLGAALAEYGYPAAARAWRQLAVPDRMVTLGVAPLRIDVMTSITGVSFAQAWRGRVELDVHGMKIAFLGKAELLANKLASGRDKDLLDAKILQMPVSKKRRR